MKTKAEQLVRSLRQRGILQDKRLIRAFLNVPLEDFIPKNLTDDRRIYEDIPQLFYSRPPTRRTISAPHMICIMLQNLCLEENDNLLILGSKSGYISAIASHLCPGGEIIIVESIKELVDITRKNLDRTGFGKNITIIHANVVYGLKESGPWQKILVTGQVEKEDLDYVIYQLDPNGGMLFAPIGNLYKQDFTQIVRNGDDFYYKKMGEVIFGPLDLYEPSIPEEDTDQKLPERYPPVQFKLDINFLDKNARKFLERHGIREPKLKKIDDEELINTAIQLARENSGFIHVITIADLLDMEPEKLINILKKSKTGILEDFGTSNLVTTIFILKEEIQDTITQSIEVINKLVDLVKNMKNQYKLDIILDYLNEFDREIEDLSDTGLESIFGIKRLKNLANSIRSNINLLTRLEEKISSNPKLLEQSKDITNQQIQDIEEINENLQELLRRLHSWQI
ncbi:MAG: protein-L-isoaspartate O-methyltransferase [Promethearchaeota archaeon]